MQRAVNPQTGEVLFLVNNQWTPPSQTAKNPKTGQSAYLVNNEWQILDPFKMGQESGEAKTTNPFLGFVGRGAELIGSGVEAVAEVGERLGDKLELAMPLSNLTPEQVKNEQQLKPLFDFAKSLEDFNKNIGYSPSTKLSDLPGNPLKTIPFVAERVITSTPDMAAAFAAAPAYFTARTKEILDERVKNDNKTLDDATIGDVSTAAGAAAFETLFERFAVGRLLPGGGATGKTAPGRIAKETGIQSGTEFAEEFGTYAAETAGTKKGFDLEEASLAGLEGAIVGGGLGATVQTSKEGLDAYRRSKDQTSPDAEPEDPISTTPAGPVDPTLTAPITPTPVLEQEGAIAPEVVPPEVVPPEAIAPEVVPPESIAPAPQIAPVSQPTPIQIYNNPLDEVTAEVIANPDNRFSILMTDLATGQTMDGGTFDTADEANARAAQSIGMSVKPIAYIGPVQAPPQTTPPTIAPPAVTPPEVPAATPPASIEAAPTTSPEVAPAVEPAATPTITPPADTPIGQEPVIPTSGFRTEKGSIYALDDLGRTSRTKMSEGKGKGTTYDPHAALYVTPEDAQSILSDMQSGSMDQGASVRLGYIDVENNVFKNITDTSQIPAGAEAVVGVIDKNKNQMIGFYKAQLKPAIGLAPVEKLYTPDGMSNTHIGNKIVELFGQTTPAVKPTITPETPPETPPASTRTEQEVQIDINRIRQQIRQAKTAVTKGTVGPEVVSPLEAKLEALENELSQVKATPRSAPTPPKLPETPPPPKKLKFEIDKTPPEIYKEISKLDIPGLAQWAVDNAPNDFAKEVASKIQSRIKDFSSRNINMKGPVILNDTSRVRGYKGKVTYKLTKGGFEFIYRLNGLVRGKEAPGHGLDYQTILHELVHAATVIQTVGLKKSDPRIQDLEKLRRQIRTKFKKDLAENKFDQVKQKATINHISYMLKNVDELMAVGLSDGEVQKYLKTVKVSKDFNAFGKLVEIARQILGLPPNTQSALEALASTTDQMLSSPLEKLDADLRESGRFKVSRKSDDEADVEIDKDIVTINLQEPQDDLFNKEAQILSELDQELPKAKKKLPPGRSPELTAIAELLREGKITKQEFDAAVNKYRPIPLYAEPLEPATDKQVVDALSSDKKPAANIDIPTGTKVGLRLDIPAWNNHKTFVVSIHEGRAKITSASPGKVIGYRSVAIAKNVTFGLGNQRKALDIAAGGAKDALQTMEGEYVNISPADALEMAKKAFKDDRYIQLGFDPTRHSYFYDRKTTKPVVKADAILQIGNMILARGVEYGEKFSESFLYNIDAPQSNLFSNQENKVLKQTDDVAPSGKKVVTKNRSPELTAAAQQLSRGEITKEEYEAAVQRFSPVSVYAEPPKPASNAQVVEALDANKKKDANVNIESGTKVGLRLDIPAWENKKTWVVAIHEGKPKITSPKADKILSYRSVAALENVVFGIGNQTKTLAIAAGEFKDKLQTMEGEYVNISPDEAYRRAQEFIKDPAYIQVGFNPLRHAYFYDRRTMLPVVKADEVLQIGNLILAKNATYGTKEDFLFNIDSTPEMTEAEISQGVTDVREEQIAEYARLRAKRERLVQEVIGGANTIDTQRELTNLDNVTKALKEEIDAEYTPSTSPANFLNRALKAFDKGDMSAEVLATIQEAYNKTPFILNGLRLSIKTPKTGQVLKNEGFSEMGSFNVFERIVTLWNGTGGVERPGTVRHELMHSLEQMMTAAQRKVLVEEYIKDFKKASKKNTDAQSQLYFKKVLDFIDNPSQESFAAATAAMPSYDFYQYINPSEYWAVNAETLMASKLGTAWGRFVTAIKKYLEALKNVFGFNNRYAVHKIFDQLMSDKPKRMSFDVLTDFVGNTGARPVTLSNISQNVFGQPLPEASWGRPDDSKIDNIIYTLQDKQIDTKRVVESIKKSGKEIADKWNPYLQEELYHGRTATQTKDFLDKELAPLMKELRDRDLTMEVVEEYLHNRHAKARNEFNAKRDPNMPDGGSGILTADAQAYLDGLDPKQKRNLEAVAKLVDDIVNKTQEVIVSTGQESQETVDAWKKALTNYVPLQREETDYDIKNVGIGVGSGFAVKGPFSRAAVGSSRKVVDILANLAAQRERAIVRGEKMRVAKALYGLVASNPNPGFWLAFDPEAIKNPQEALNDLMSLGLKNDKGEKFSAEDLKSFVSEPMVRRVDEATNQVVLKPNALLKNASTTFPVRINGKEKYIIFNANDPRAARMAKEMKNLDADQLSRILGYTQQITQYFAKINTQYNPIFGVINFARDIQGAILQLSTTPLRYEKKKVLAGVAGSLRGIYAEERGRRAGNPPSKNSYAELWREFQEEGGQTGFRDQFSRMQDRADALQAILDPSSWTKSPLGKVFTANGTLKVPLETARKAAAPVFDWLSDYNQTMENAVRLSAYKVAKEKGMTKQQAASLAKNLTVNFNRKGQIGRQAGALYAFFNAAVQGTARMLETLRGPAKKKIIAGGLLLGSAQAMLLAAFGFDEDEPPDFVKERNIVIPTGGGKYITVPMPLGYNVIPNTSRILTEWTMSGFKDTHKRVAQITGAALDMFNPIGNAGWSIQTLAPTVADPLVALAENKDWTGKPIAKEDISNLDPTPGYSRSKETASYISKAMAKFLNAATGGTDYTPGGASPTPDQIDYLIGQLTGGVGRELLKAEQTVTSQFTGEELPIYKVPLVGRFVGDSEGQAAERNRFYNNIILLNKHEREIKGRQKDRIPARDYLMEYPEARLYSYANQVERNIRTLRKRRDALIEQDAPKERVKQVENQMTVQMKRFNERVKSAQE
jgi:K+/H+ antiporter YhaU regulatory subunit KhtT